MMQIELIVVAADVFPWVDPTYNASESVQRFADLWSNAVRRAIPYADVSYRIVSDYANRYVCVYGAYERNEDPELVADYVNELGGNVWHYRQDEWLVRA